MHRLQGVLSRGEHMMNGAPCQGDADHPERAGQHTDYDMPIHPRQSSSMLLAQGSVWPQCYHFQGNKNWYFSYHTRQRMHGQLLQALII